MAWVVGIDEAGYGPNLGPFVMSAVACRTPDDLAGADLWHHLRPAVRRGCDPDDGRVVIDDSKVVYSTTRGLAGLERGVLGTLRGALGDAGDVSGLLASVCRDGRGAWRAEAWFAGTGLLPSLVPSAELAEQARRFDEACAAAGVSGWVARSVVVCPAHFNGLLDAHGSKGAVLAHALARLLRCAGDFTTGPDSVAFFIDKHGGRNAYAAQLQDALTEGAVVAAEEGMARSVYRVLGVGREVRLTFQPRADAAHFCVALASMASKYVRELLMRDFNAFWQKQVPGLKATAGYPRDAARFLEAIRPAAARLGIAEAALWRRK
jgi:ribonuclease HII